MTFEIACVARTAKISYKALSKLKSSIFQHTILFTDISTGDFLPTQDCARLVSSLQRKRESIREISQSVSAFRGASKMPAMIKTDEVM